MNIVTELIEKIEGTLCGDFKLYEPYIRYIRFPHYKSIVDGTKIEFDFPLTIFVGANGTNKTSILQALYGCPKGKNVGIYWFSTDVDKVDEKEKHCLIYGYNHLGANKIVEVLKSRIDKEENKDYWEPSRPIIGYDMVKSNIEEYEKSGNSNTTRWDTIIKNVIYMDCKEYLPAFDLMFYHSLFNKTVRFKTKQEFIRSRSKMLNTVVTDNLTKYDFYSIQRIRINRLLSDETCRIVSEIMGKNYKKIRIIDHSLYTQNHAKTILIKEGELEYTEAFAGSGESRIIMLVDSILNAKDKSLILIDEPEISLHPAAQKRFRDFVLEQIVKKKHQVFITTHSPTMIADLPKTAIKLLRVRKTDKKIEVLSDIHWKSAFIEIGHEEGESTVIYVEDKLSQKIIEKYIKCKYNNSIVPVIYLPGGAEAIIKQHVSIAAAEKRNTYFILDGDKNYYPFEELNSHFDIENITNSWKKIQENQIAVGYNSKLEYIIQKMTKVNKIQFSYDGNQGNPDQEQKIKVLRNFIKFWEKNVWFLPEKTPEEALLKSMGVKLGSETDFKRYFEEKACEDLGEEVDSEDIYNFQRKCINKLGDDCELFKQLDDVFKNILG
ncbi:ATP-dependent nuclease [Acetobacterium woodii]|uniref:Endonuclease GajA/Old nuclease/RecF-like AAA domain-containing protein n=1 Tax=Acetobacterium woodii (strain ATCC 29683 / DSM 1030 / JCM 2381 / KCTC 1655 / WB1) TaxID=931626 RepID=H6LJ72_ACEWD|nr:ATP-binding protein [Acetobacterium woodii]AFA48635.1 hypothetical protein Awo_c18560 [Acetobacterium woodii DSM 1030]